jgi:threonine-phosphate decarboxylase
MQQSPRHCSNRGVVTVDPDAVESVSAPVHGSSDDPDLLDFSANANPRVPDGVTAVYEQACDRSTGLSPDQEAAFREQAAAYVDCDRSAVVPTRGGLTALRLAIAVTVTPGDSVLVPAPSFSEYAREVRLQGGTPSFVPAERITSANPAAHTLAIVCRPNNPTGRLQDDDALRSFLGRCRDHGTPVLIDEAFLDFTDRDSLAGTPGVVVARSLTKLFGFPGLRAGFAVATGDLGERLQTARQPHSVSAPALAVGRYCMTQSGFVAETKQRVRSERRRMREALEAQFEVAPSSAPFLLLDAGDRDVDELLAHARNQGVALRDARSFRRLDSHVRVAVRLPEENDRLLEVLGDGF